MRASLFQSRRHAGQGDGGRTGAFYVIHLLAASPIFDADWPRWLQSAARGPSRASRRDRKKFDTPFFFVVRFRGNDNNRPQSPGWFQVYLSGPQ